MPSRGGHRPGAGRKKQERPTNANVATRVLAEANSEQLWLSIIEVERRRLGLNKDGTLSEREKDAISGPRTWQCEELELLGAHLQNPETRYTVYQRWISSGHGPGKTTLLAFLAWWNQSTFLDAMARITANTDRQLTGTTSP